MNRFLPLPAPSVYGGALSLLCEYCCRCLPAPSVYGGAGLTNPHRRKRTVLADSQINRFLSFKAKSVYSGAGLTDYVSIAVAAYQHRTRV